MGFLAPLALIGLISVPIIVAFYMLRLRRPERAVSSTFLWQQLVRDVEANAPWQKLRRSLLLLLQILLAIIFAVLVARPFAEHPAGLARDLVLVIDASASMSATDDFPTRLEAAKRLAIEQMGEVPSDGRVSVVSATETARVVANEATDRGRISRAIESIEASTGASNLTDALKLAASLAQRARGAEILVITDDAGSVLPDVSLEVPVRVATVGRERNNQAIAALAVRSDSSGLRRTLFVSVANYSAEAVGRRLEILADNTSVTARDLALQPLSRADVVIDELPPGATVVQARITAPAGSGSPVSSATDYLPLDDSAWAIVPPDRLRKVLLVGPGNVYLQNAFSLLPNVELYGATAAEYPNTTGMDLYDLIVFDGFLPPELPNKPILAFAPPATSDLGVVSGTLEEFGMGQPSADDPLLRGVDLTRLHIAKTQNMELPDWGRAVVPGSPGPLVYAGLRQGLATVVFAFDIRQSDLPLQIAWPILVSNVAGELLGVGPQQNFDPLPPASPVEIPITQDATGVRITLPDGTVEEIAPGATGASTVSFVNTRQLGVYRVEVIKAPAPSASPAATPGATPTPSTTPGASGSPQPAPAADDPNMFAVDLFAPDESNIRPGDGARISSLGTDLPPAEQQTGTARDEFWPLVAALALAFLLVEWIVYERDGARRILNAIRGANPFANRGRATGRKGAG
ncbi:MAG TPA: BatA and WFA domain-containing protein [Candidatus Limnocylindrales bacterium]|nr:BatA and WFA domain-containing protein [Candidatus Limnocylindrales bacterium]